MPLAGFTVLGTLLTPFPLPFSSSPIALSPYPFSSTPPLLASYEITLILNIVCIALLIWKLSWQPAIATLGVYLIFSLPYQWIATVIIEKHREKAAEVAGSRISIMSEVLASSKIVKLFNWEGSFFNIVRFNPSTL